MSLSKKYFAFISYSRKDIELATEIKDEVERICGVHCWMDMEGIESGEQFEDVIISAIDNSKIVIFLMSNNSMSSTYTKKEVRYADSMKKKIIPLNIDGSKPMGWFLFHFGGTDVIYYNNSEQRAKYISNLKEWSINFNNETKINYPLLFNCSNGNKPIQYIFLLIDTSGSMYGDRINTINEACSKVLNSLELINPDIEIQIAVLSFNHRSNWMYHNPISLDEFVWIPLCSNGLTNMGLAFEELNIKMSKSDFFSHSNGVAFLPSLIILINDGHSSDNYTKGLKELYSNKYFKKSLKFAVGIGDDYSVETLMKFTGNAKRVFHFYDEGSDEFGALLNRLLTMGLYAGSVAAMNESDDNL